MVDQAKRTTLKGAAALGLGTAVATLSGNSIAALVGSQSSTSYGDGLDEVEITTRLSSRTNELEIVITNSGQTPYTITDMTPAEIHTVRGRFDFNALFADGDVTLGAGENVVVPMQHHSVVLNSSSITRRVSDLQSALRRNVSVITGGDALAVVSLQNQVIV